MSQVRQSGSGTALSLVSSELPSVACLGSPACYDDHHLLLHMVACLMDAWRRTAAEGGEGGGGVGAHGSIQQVIILQKTNGGTGQPCHQIFCAVLTCCMLPVSPCTLTSPRHPPPPPTPLSAPRFHPAMLVAHILNHPEFEIVTRPGISCVVLSWKIGEKKQYIYIYLVLCVIFDIMYVYTYICLLYIQIYVCI